MGDRKRLQEQPPEQAGEDAHREEEARPTRYPALAVGRDATARHDHVHKLCSTEMMPIRAPKCFGSAATVSIVSAETLNKRS